MKRPSKISLPFYCWILCSLMPLTSALRAEDASEKSPTTEEAAEEEPEVLAFVLFLKQPRKLSKQSIVAAVTKAWQLTPESAGKLDLRRKDGNYLLRHENLEVLIESKPEPWLEDQPQVIEESSDLRMKGMLRRVKGHLAISIDNQFTSDDERDAAVTNCLHLLAAFIDFSDTLAIYDDESGDFNYVNDEVREMLAGDDPLNSFEIEVAPPVTQINANDPAMEAAIAEARRRWPEFSKNFRDYSDSRGPFLVKSGFGKAGEQEYMWSEVLEIRSGTISAILKNEPLHQNNLSLGDKIEIPLSTLGDWVYPDEEGAKIGAFTMGVLQEAAEKKPQP